MSTFVFELLDDKANGIIHSYSDDTIYQAYKIPRSFTDDALSLEFIENPGVYLLIKVSSVVNKIRNIFITSTYLRTAGGNAISQINDAQKVIDWTEAIVFTTENNSWGATELMYLENAFYEIIENSKRYNVINESAPSAVPTNKRTKSAMDKFMTWAVNLLGIFGYKIGEQYDTKEVSRESTQNTTEPERMEQEENDGDTQSEDPVTKHGKPHMPVTPERDDSHLTYPIRLHMTVHEAMAVGMYDGQNLTVLKGSTLNPKTGKSCSPTEKAHRDKYLNYKNTNVLDEDVVFTSPSSAAKFISGSSLNGYDYWFNDDGVSLNDLVTIDKKGKSTPTQQHRSTPAYEETPSQSRSILFHMSCKNAYASGFYDGSIFTLCKGSVVCPDKSASCQDTIVNFRKKYSNLIDDNNMLTEDIVFKSPSGAAGFVAFHSMSGNSCWRDKHGVSLGELVTKKKIPKGITPHAQSNPPQNGVTPASDPGCLILYMTTRGSNAFGMYDGNQFMVCKDSVLCAEPAASCSDNILKLRETYADKIDNNILTEDVTFKKPSTAAEFITLKSENGYTCWHDSYGNDLNTILKRNPKRKTGK